MPPWADPAHVLVPRPTPSDLTLEVMDPDSCGPPPRPGPFHLCILRDHHELPMRFLIWVTLVFACSRPTGDWAARAKLPARCATYLGAIWSDGGYKSQTPNELGYIPIVEYHSIGGEPEFNDGIRYDRHGLNIAPETLKRHLEKMYAAGWYPVNMRDIVTHRMRVPRGRIPVALTFDDSRPTQFRYLPDGSIDPNCAVGILEAFHAQHPDWPCRATFYVLPESRWNGVPFDQDGLEGRKLRFLVRTGYEVANHSTSHRSLSDLGAASLRWELAQAVRQIRRLAPRATMDSLALPYGIPPKDRRLWSLLIGGTQGGTKYRNRCVLLATGGPSRPLVHRLFDRTQVPRIEPEPGNLERWIADLRPGDGDAPFVSDGRPGVVTIPRSELPNLNRSRLHGARLVVIP